MPRIAILGGSVVGSVTAMLFARSGWEVMLVDPALDEIVAPPTPLRPRAGAPHAVHAHGFMSRTLRELTTRLPDVRAALATAGAPVVNPVAGPPPHLYDGGRSDDAELDTLRVRRVTLDRVISGCVADEPGVSRPISGSDGARRTPTRCRTTPW